MAVYKVPQDVEADDKLLGPFSFRQFIYLIIAIMGGVLAWGFSQILLPLAIIPLPIIALFTILALPLRKDQPMEVYLAAVISFYLKPRKRLWKADGIQSLVEIVTPNTVEERLTKELSEREAEERLSYLANLVDSRGWAVRGVDTPTNTMQDDVFFEAQQTPDILDEASPVINSFDAMINKADSDRRQAAMDLMNRPAAASETPAAADPYASLGATQGVPATTTQPTQPVAEPDPSVTFNPYPSSMRQSVIQPQSAQPNPQPPVQPIEPPQLANAPSQPVVSPDIINLANNSDLSIQTIAHEAKRIREKEGLSSDEVVISLR